MPHQPNHKDLTRLIRQLREALELTRSPNFRFLSFAPPGHFYSPIPDVSTIEGDGYQLFDPSSEDTPGLDLNINSQLDFLNDMSSYKNEIPWPAEGSDPSLRFHFDNDYFSFGDASVLYGMMRQFQPRRIIEIGSGFSTAAMLDIDELFLDKVTDVTSIDPHAERLKSLLNSDDLSRITQFEMPVQEVDLSLFEELNANDILFIDSSHVSKAGSDVNLIVHLILPSLAPGVIIQFHDIFWPFEYPKKWLKAGRAWNEAYLLFAFLQYNSAFEFLFFNSYMEKHHRDVIRQKLPIMLRQPSSKMTFGNSSLWLRKK